MEPVSVPTGPFEVPPVELGRKVTCGFDTTVTPREIAESTQEWLVSALGRCQVELGAEDRAVAEELAEDVGWTGVQVVAGWVARAARPEQRRR